MWFGRLLAIFIGLIVFIIILVMLFGRGGGDKNNPSTNQVQLQPLAEYAGTNATVSFTTDGIINADELHRAIRITVSNNQVTLDVLRGYNPQVIQSRTFQNNQEAYSVFLKAINNAGFLLKTKNKNIPADPAGQCPLGNRYILNLNQDGVDLSNTWASTCGNKVGTSTGSIQTIRTLFQYQVPGYNRLVGEVNLSATSPEL